MTSNFNNPNQNVVNGSVQTQFASIARDRDSLRNLSRTAERDRRLEEAKTQKLRAYESSLSEKIRAAHADLGTKTKKREILKQETARLEKGLSNDRKAIEDFAGKMKAMVKEERERKEQFVVRMDSLNEELEDVLRRDEESSLSESVVSIESCKILQDFVNEKVLQQKEEDPAYAQYREIHDALLTAVDRLKTITAKHLEEYKGNEKLKHEALMSRNSFKIKSASMSGKPFGDIELDDLERQWEKQKPEQQPMNMDLFYGARDIGNSDDHTHGGTNVSASEIHNKDANEDTIMVSIEDEDKEASDHNAMNNFDDRAPGGADVIETETHNKDADGRAIMVPMESEIKEASEPNPLKMSAEASLPEVNKNAVMMPVN